MRYWFTADTHYNHGNIIKYTNRPYKDVDEMNNVLIKNYNDLVADLDQVIFIGDFGFGDPFPIIERLAGQKTFIRGNHDYGKSLNPKIENILIRYAGKEIYLTHEPEDAMQMVDINLVGHVHAKWKIKRFGSTILINVGVDVWDYKPVSLSEIYDLYEKFIIEEDEDDQINAKSDFNSKGYLNDNKNTD